MYDIVLLAVFQLVRNDFANVLLNVFKRLNLFS